MHLPDGAVIEGLTHAFSPSTEAWRPRWWTSATGSPEDFARAGAAGKIALVRQPGDAGQGVGRPAGGDDRADLRPIGPPAQHDRDDDLGDAGARAPPGASRARPCLSVRRRRRRAHARAAVRGPLARPAHDTRVRTGWIADPAPDGAARRDAPRTASSSSPATWTAGTTAPWTTAPRTRRCSRSRGCWRRGGSALRRGLRLAFWSGHSHGRYAGSAWYADHAWRELHRRCAVHLNMDSTGARGATDYSVVHATEDAQSFVEGGGARRHRPGAAGPPLLARGRPVVLGRSGSLGAYVALRDAQAGHRPLALRWSACSAARAFPGGGTREEDTIDKIDADVLALDTRVYVAAALALVGGPLLPLDYVRVRARPRGDGGGARPPPAAVGLAPAARGGPASRRAGRARSRGRSTPSPPRARSRGAGGGRQPRAGAPLAGADAAGLHERRPFPPRPRDARCRRWPGSSGRASWRVSIPTSDEYRFARAALVRERNRVGARPRGGGRGDRCLRSVARTRGRRVPSAEGARRAGREERRHVDA